MSCFLHLALQTLRTSNPTPQNTHLLSFPPTVVCAYSARLYESERQMSDWYVEKRMLEDHIAKLSEEIRSRDHLDAEIEGCVCSLFARLQHAELSNQQLRKQLQDRGSDVGPNIPSISSET